MRIRLIDKMNGVSTNVNLIRFISAVSVLVCHSFYIANNSTDWIFLFSGGQINLGGIAVGVFFFFSGFYVTKSMYKSKSVGEFIRKRCDRIFPQLWIVILLSVFVLGPIMASSSVIYYFSNALTYKYLLNGLLIPIHNLPSGVFENNIFDSSVNGSLWTMPVEFLLYCGLAIVFVFGIYILNNRIEQKHLHLIVLICAIISFFVITFFLRNELLIQVIRPSVIFFFGVIYYDYRDRIVLDFRYALIALVMLLISLRFGCFDWFYMLLFPYVLTTFCIGTPQIKHSGIITKISYEMYLLAWPIQQTITHLYGGKMSIGLNILISFVIDLILAIMLYKCVLMIEKTCLIRKKDKNEKNF